MYFGVTNDFRCYNSKHDTDKYVYIIFTLKGSKSVEVYSNKNILQKAACKIVKRNKKLPQNTVQPLTDLAILSFVNRPLHRR